MASNRDINLTGNGSAVISTDGNFLSAYVTQVLWNETPTEGVLLIEYRSSESEPWRQFRAGAINYASQPQPLNASAKGHMIRQVRITTAGVEVDASVNVKLFLRHDSDTAFDERIYGGNMAINTQPFTEANVKNGTQFSASTYFTGITAGENIDVIIITGDKPVAIKAQYIAIEDGDDLLANWFKDPDYTGGSNLTAGIYNQSDINPQATSIQLIGVAPTNAAAGNYAPNDATKPAVTSVGTRIQPLLAALGVSGQGSSTSSKNATLGLEQILAPNSVYLYRRTAVGAIASMFGFSTWYEGELSSDL